MNFKKIMTVIAISAITFFSACKKKTTDQPTPTPVVTTNVITTQTTLQLPINLAGATGLAILAGTNITNIGATSVTDYIPKPIDEKLLYSKIVKHLQKPESLVILRNLV